MKWKSSLKSVVVTRLAGVCVFASQPQANTVVPPAGGRQSGKAITLGKDKIIRQQQLDTCWTATILLRPVVTHLSNTWTPSEICWLSSKEPSDMWVSHSTSDKRVKRDAFGLYGHNKTLIQQQRPTNPVCSCSQCRSSVQNPWLKLPPGSAGRADTNTFAGKQTGRHSSAQRPW